MERPSIPTGSLGGRVQYWESETLIIARNSTVWEVLTDKSTLTVWDSGITGLTGDLRHGVNIRIKLTEAVTALSGCAWT